MRNLTCSLSLFCMKSATLDVFFSHFAFHFSVFLLPLHTDNLFPLILHSLYRGKKGNINNNYMDDYPADKNNS